MTSLGRGAPSKQTHFCHTNAQFAISVRTLELLKNCNNNGFPDSGDLSLAFQSILPGNEELCL